MIGLLLLAVLQGAAPKLEVAVDQDRVSVGEDLVYTIQAASRSLEPVELSMAPLSGFDVMSRIERSELSSADAPTRTTILELHLRATRPGRWRLGPVTARVAGHMVEAGIITVQVDPSRTPAAFTLTPRIRRMLERAPPPPRGQPAVSLLVSDERVRVGEQVDIVTAAWFPRDLRVQLRRPPMLQPPVVDGVWTYPQNTPAAIVATRTIGGVVYDLFVAHQIVFPLAPGTVTIPAATLKYGTPIALQFLSREERYALSSRPGSFAVQPLPAAGRPADFSGAVASGLRLERKLGASTAKAGQAVTVEYVLSGEGNTALWPAPNIEWPAGVRAYAERVEEKVAPVDGRLGGSKTFRYLVVPDSVGVLRLPGVTYSHFDLGSNRYLTSGVSPASMAVTSTDEVATTAALPPSLLQAEGPSWSWRIAHEVPAWTWMLLLLLPPLAIVAFARLPRRDRRPAAVAPSDSLAVAEARLETVIGALVPDPSLRTDRSLAAALRAVGVDGDTIGRVVAARDRILASRYAPGGNSSNDPGLVADIDALVDRLSRLRRRARAHVAVLLLFGSALTIATAPAMVAAQAPSPEQLYATGALRAAADGFADRTITDPAVSAHWYGLGASYYRLGLKGRAVAAWVHARRLDPREPALRRAMQLIPPPDPISARWTWVPPVRPEELLLLGLVGWFFAWFGWVGRPRARDRWAVLLVFSGAAVLAGLALRYWYERPVAIVAEGTELRLSPHGRAPEITRLEAGGAVLVLQERAGWVFVRMPDDREGWLPEDAVASIGA